MASNDLSWDLTLPEAVCDAATVVDARPSPDAFLCCVDAAKEAEGVDKLDLEWQYELRTPAAGGGPDDLSSAVKAKVSSR